ncbi:MULTISPECIES: hypothetical protein [Azospirillum]|uniref:hypothetical protein n=1 Tax=Azospirillum TaxID=191 RepID=UPI00190E4FB9|nr:MULTISPECIES: hypothetical protein [Azospirillum]
MADVTALRHRGTVLLIEQTLLAGAVEQRLDARPRPGPRPGFGENALAFQLPADAGEGHRDADGSSWIVVKGAPESILDMCSLELTHSGGRPLDIDHWRRMATDTGAQGLRLFALAYRRARPAADRLNFADVESGYTMLALVGIVDPPREEAIPVAYPKRWW